MIYIEPGYMEMPQSCASCPLCHHVDDAAGELCSCRITLCVVDVTSDTRDYCPLHEIDLDQIKYDKYREGFDDGYSAGFAEGQFFNPD